MNILLLDGSREWTGGAKRVLLTARELKKTGNAVVVACRRESPLGDAALSEGIPVERMNPLGDIGFITMLRIVHLLKKYTIRILDISSPVFFKTGVIAGRIAGVRIVITRNVAFRKRFLKRVTNRLFYSFAHGIIAVSHRVRKNLINNLFLNGEKIHVVEDGVDTGEMKPAGAPETAAFRKTFGIDGRKTVGVITRLAPTKGHQLLLDAVLLVARELDDIVFLIAGTGKSAGEIRARIDALNLRDRVIMTGFRNDIPVLLSSVDITVNPSLSEGFGMCVLESLACGKAVVGFKGVVPEELIIHGRTGIIVDRPAPEALARGIISILRSDYRQMGKNGRELLSERFSSAYMASKVASLYARFDADMKV